MSSTLNTLYLSTYTRDAFVPSSFSRRHKREIHNLSICGELIDSFAANQSIKGTGGVFLQKLAARARARVYKEG